MVLRISLKKDETGHNRFFAYGEEEDFKCFRCSKPIQKGYVCENNSEMVLCEECQFMFQMYKCKHDKRGEHSHIKWERGSNDNKRTNRDDD